MPTQPQTPQQQPLKHSTEVRKQKQAATKCIYFPNENDIDALETFLAKYPRASMSSIIAQLVQAFNSQSTDLPPGERCVVLNGAKIWI